MAFILIVSVMIISLSEVVSFIDKLKRSETKFQKKRKALSSK